jgi:hypothetical protein
MRFGSGGFHLGRTFIQIEAFIHSSPLPVACQGGSDSPQNHSVLVLPELSGDPSALS